MTFPPASIAVNTEDIVDQCELLEISGGIYEEQLHQPQFVLVTELAALLYLGQYQHARHLWRRTYVSNSSPPFEEEKDPELKQFIMLYDVARSMLSNNQDPTGETFVRLNACVKSKLSPLSQYALEIRNVYRERMVRVLERGYKCLSQQSCQTLLGYNNTNKDVETMKLYLQELGWTSESTTTEGGQQIYWIPSRSSSGRTRYFEQSMEGSSLDKKNNDDDNGDGMNISTDMTEESSALLPALYDDRIGELVEIVGFMERKRTNV